MSWNWSNESEGSLGAQVDGPGYMAGRKLAGWGWRMLAGCIDYGLTFVIPYGIFKGSAFAWILAMLLTLFNSGFMAAHTTQSLGKKITGVKMVWVKRDARRDLYVVPVPVVVGILRVFLHAFDCFCCIGFVLPIFNKSKGTLADYTCKTLNFRDPNLPEPQHGVVGTTEWV